MATDQTRNVSLTAELNAFIRAQVASGQYQNASEVVRAGLRLLQRQEQRQPAQGSHAAFGSGWWMMNRKPDFPSQLPALLAGGGMMERLIRTHDWSTSASWATHRPGLGVPQDRRQPHASGRPVSRPISPGPTSKSQLSTM